MMATTVSHKLNNKIEIKLPEMNVNEIGLKPLEDENRIKYQKYMQIYDHTMKNFRLTSYLKNKVEKNL